MYIEKFSQAVSLSKKLNIFNEDIKLENTSFLDDKDVFTLMNLLFSDAYIYHIVGKCDLVTALLCKAINKQGICKAYMTTGSTIDVKANKKVFTFSEKIATQSVRKKKFDNKSCKHHCWVTLSSGEIIDPTILVTKKYLDIFINKPFEAMKNFPEEMPILYGNSDNISDKYIYIPTIVGENFYTKYFKYYSFLYEKFEYAVLNEDLDVLVA